MPYLYVLPPRFKLKAKLCRKFQLVNIPIDFPRLYQKKAVNNSSLLLFQPLRHNVEITALTEDYFTTDRTMAAINAIYNTLL